MEEKFWNRVLETVIGHNNVLLLARCMIFGYHFNFLIFSTLFFKMREGLDDSQDPSQAPMIQKSAFGYFGIVFP